MLKIVLSSAMMAALSTAALLNTSTQYDGDQRLIQNRVMLQQAIISRFAETGAMPAKIESAWFPNQQMPIHPDCPATVPLLEIVNEPNQEDPENFLLDESSAGAYWYNMANGMLRARVCDDPDLPAADRYLLINYMN
ncbi:MAG: hypothetical protein KDB22_17305 [Planctomycetales bacterium]|nr:hypothetical protein [Planctomycetales bacterium]